MTARLDKQNADFFIRGILNGDRVALSRAITLAESANEAKSAVARQIVDGIIHKAGNSFRLGITGVPGAGKSTFIETFGKRITEAGHKLAVLAVDPSSTRTGGSILGDKTRMEKLSMDPHVYIRPSPAAGALGGVTRVTYETILMCEAAGYDFIIVETVGVGQSETSVSDLTDFFLLLMLAGAGDELQGIKRGIIEMADAVVISKADGDNEQKANAARAEYAQALHLFPLRARDWKPRTLTCSAITGKGIGDATKMIEEFRAFAADNDLIQQRRKERQATLLRDALQRAVMDKFFREHDLHAWFAQVEQKGMLNPFGEVKALLDRLK